VNIDILYRDSGLYAEPTVPISLFSLAGSKIGDEAAIYRRPFRSMDIPVYFPLVRFELKKSFDDKKKAIDRRRTENKINERIHLNK